jgi:hypothetical protein
VIIPTLSTRAQHGHALQTDIRIDVVAHRENAMNRRMIALYRVQNPLCERCRIKPTQEIHHVHPVAEGGQSDPTNLLALCIPCHVSINAIPRDTQLTWKTDFNMTTTTAHVPRYVICGLPGAGKSTWVLNRITAGDLVWDLDTVAATLNQRQYPRPAHVLDIILAMRAALIAHLATNTTTPAYIIVSDRREAQDIAGTIRGQVIHLEISEQERQRRLAARGTR